MWKWWEREKTKAVACCPWCYSCSSSSFKTRGLEEVRRLTDLTVSFRPRQRWRKLLCFSLLRSLLLSTRSWVINYIKGVAEPNSLESTLILMCDLSSTSFFLSQCVSCLLIPWCSPALSPVVNKLHQRPLWCIHILSSLQFSSSEKLVWGSSPRTSSPQCVNA